MKRLVLLFGALAIGSFSRAAAPAEERTLGEAVRRNDAPRWQALLQAKTDLNAADAAGNTALHHAALNHDVAAVSALVAAGATIDAKNAAEATPLLYGAGSDEIVRLLLAHGANSNAASKAQITPLMVAVKSPDSFDRVQQLVAAGADVRATRRPDEEFILNRAIESGDARTIALLIARGAEVNPKKGFTPLAQAAFQGDLATVKLLVEKGAALDQPDDFAGSALNIALYAHHDDVAQFLITKGADLAIRSPRGHGTPAMVFAAYNQAGDPAVARELVARQADVNVANDEGATALGFALRNGGHTPLVAYLREAGAKAPEAARAKRVPARAVPDSPAARAALVRERLPATLGLLEKSSAAFLGNAFVQKANCVSCHGQDLAAVALESARGRGLPVDDAELGRIVAALRQMWEKRVEPARQMGEPVPDAVVSLGYGLMGLRAMRYAPDDMTDAMVHYLLRTQRTEGRWTSHDRRPPMEDGLITGTAWAALAVRDYAPAGRERERAESQRRSARWLAAQVPGTHNDAVFQLLGLHWSSEPAAKLGAFAARIAQTQRPDGGWAQLPELESDAWATGTALYALHEAGGMAVTDSVYQRGVAFLLRTQFEDGSWWVKSRTWPFQPHFDGQFPHGKDQWISQGAAGWATLALLPTLEPVSAPAPGVEQLLAAYANSPAARRQKASAAEAAPAPAAKVDFKRDVQPLLERSCAGCHGGEKPRGGMVVATRESLLKGGQSGEPAITPGDAAGSPLLKYVADKVEDLEMPPLDRREKYPALNAAEIATLRAWIESGAPAQ